MRVLITGGAGFIGRALVEQVLVPEQRLGVIEAIKVVDVLDPQVHPQGRRSPEWLSDLAESDGVQAWCTDVIDREQMWRAFVTFRPTHVIHLAAKVGVGQGQIEVARYTSTNVTGTAVLMEIIARYNEFVVSEDVVAQAEAEVNAWDEKVQALSDGPGEDFDVNDWIDGDEDIADRRKVAILRWEDSVIGNRERAAETYKALAARPNVPVSRVFVAGSMSAYGEGLYVSASGDVVRGGIRSNEDLDQGIWMPRNPNSGIPLVDVKPIPEVALRSESVYAYTKEATEKLALLVGKARGFDVVVGRYFNAVGPGQTLGNPYTGVLAIFISAALRGNPPLVYEDGLQVRDFIDVLDVARATWLLTLKGEAGEVYNVGTGEATSILALAQAVTLAIPDAPPAQVTGAYRSGDIRSCIADSSKLRALGWKPTVPLHDTVGKTVAWAKTEAAERDIPDRSGEAFHELVSHGLIGLAESDEE